MEKLTSRSKQSGAIKALALGSVVTGAAALLGINSGMLCLVLVSMLIGVVI